MRGDEQHVVVLKAHGTEVVLVGCVIVLTQPGRDEHKTRKAWPDRAPEFLEVLGKRAFRRKLGW